MCGPRSERPLDRGARLFWRDPSDDDDRRQVGAEDPAMVRVDVVQAKRLDRGGSRLAERWIVCGYQRRLERPLRDVLRTLETPGKLSHELRAHRVEGLLGQARMHHVICEETDGTPEVVVEDAHGEVCRRRLLRADLVERSLEREPIERGRAIAEEPLENLVHALLTRWSFQARV